MPEGATPLSFALARMRASVVLNPGTLEKLGIHRGRERIAASCEANNLAATIALVPGSWISHRIEDEFASSQAGGLQQPLLSVACYGGCHGPGSASSPPAGRRCGGRPA